MFGIANQLLAAVALCVATTIIINSGKAKYSWVTVLPLSFVATTTLVAGWESIMNFLAPGTKTRNVGAGLHQHRAHRHIMVAAVINFG